MHLLRRDNKYYLSMLLIFHIALGLSFSVFGAHVHNCAAKGDIKGLAKAIKAEPTLINLENEVGRTPLHVAINSSQSEIIDWLCVNNADIHCSTYLGETLMHTAANVGNVEMLEHLRKNGVDLHCTDASKRSALHIAISSSQFDTAMKLIEWGVSVKGVTDKKETAMHLLHINAIPANLLLVLNGLPNDAEAKNFIGSTPLHTLIAQLVTAGSMPIKRLIRNRSCIYSLIQKLRLTFMIDELMRLGAKIDSQDSFGMTPLFLACLAFEPERVTMTEPGKLSLDLKEQDVEGKNRYMHPFILFLKDKNEKEEIEVNASLLHIATAYSLHLALNYLASSLDTSTELSEGNTFLHVAVQYDQLEAAKFWLERGCDINAVNNENQTALQVAVKCESYNVAYTLFDSKGINVNHKDNDGRTALHLAAEMDNKPFIKLLKRHKAKLTLKDNENLLPWEVARNNGFADAENLLFCEVSENKGVGKQGKRVVKKNKKNKKNRQDKSLSKDAIFGNSADSLDKNDGVGTVIINKDQKAESLKNEPSISYQVDPCESVIVGWVSDLIARAEELHKKNENIKSLGLLIQAFLQLSHDSQCSDQTVWNKLYGDFYNVFSICCTQIHFFLNNDKYEEARQYLLLLRLVPLDMLSEHERLLLQGAITATESCLLKQKMALGEVPSRIIQEAKRGNAQSDDFLPLGGSSVDVSNELYSDVPESEKQSLIISKEDLSLKLAKGEFEAVFEICCNLFHKREAELANSVPDDIYITLNITMSVLLYELIEKAIKEDDITKHANGYLKIKNHLGELRSRLYKEQEDAMRWLDLLLDNEKVLLETESCPEWILNLENAMKNNDLEKAIEILNENITNEDPLEGKYSDRVRLSLFTGWNIARNEVDKLLDDRDSKSFKKALNNLEMFKSDEDRGIKVEKDTIKKFKEKRRALESSWKMLDEIKNELTNGQEEKALQLIMKYDSPDEHKDLLFGLATDISRAFIKKSSDFSCENDLTAFFKKSLTSVSRLKDIPCLSKSCQKFINNECVRIKNLQVLHERCTAIITSPYAWTHAPAPAIPAPLPDPMKNLFVQAMQVILENHPDKSGTLEQWIQWKNYLEQASDTFIGDNLSDIDYRCSMAIKDQAFHISDHRSLADQLIILKEIDALTRFNGKNMEGAGKAYKQRKLDWLQNIIPSKHQRSGINDTSAMAFVSRLKFPASDVDPMLSFADLLKENGLERAAKNLYSKIRKHRKNGRLKEK